jgi:hypothetical protein
MRAKQKFQLFLLIMIGLSIVFFSQVPVAFPPALGTEAIKQRIQEVFGPTYGTSAVQIAQCESGLNPLAYNSTPVWVSGKETHALGVYQIIETSWEMTSYRRYLRIDAAANILAAHELFVGSGYRWSVHWRDCSYKYGYS